MTESKENMSSVCEQPKPYQSVHRHTFQPKYKTDYIFFEKKNAHPLTKLLTMHARMQDDLFGH